MKSRLLKNIFAATFAIGFSASQVFSQGLPNVIKRMEIGYSYAMASANYKSTEYTTTTDGKVFSYAIDKNVKSKFGYSAFIGTYIPVVRLGGNSLLAVGVNFNYGAFMWDYSVPSFQNYKFDIDGNIVGVEYGEDFNPFGYTGVTAQMAVPVSLDLKFGAEANLQKGSKWTGTFGIGAYPSGSATVDYDNAGFGYAVTPFGKAEIGIKAGIIWKLRLQYVAGDMPFYTADNSLNSTLGYGKGSSLTGKGIFSASLVLMPFSWSFTEDGWWNWKH